MSELKKIKTVIIDTLTGIQTDEWMASEKKPGHDQWMDMGKGIWNIASYLKSQGFEIIYVLGEPGTGKSCGIRTLDPETTIWFNTDQKNPTWIGGRQAYGTVSNPKLPYHSIPTSYSQIIAEIYKIKQRIGFEEVVYCFLTGHIEDYKSGIDSKKRLKTLGKVATKFQLEGRAETVLYSVVRKGTDGKMQYLLETENDGYNTARSPMGLFESVIENDYQFIINKLDTM